MELLRSRSQPLALGDIAREVVLSKPSAYRLLHTLESAGYLESDSGGQYFMPRNIRPALPSRFLTRYVQCALPRMKVLARDLRVTISLGALFENHAEVIAVVESPEALRMSNVVGRILPPNSSSLGKAMLAFQPEDRREQLIRSFGMYRFTEHTIVDEAELHRELERVRERGYGTDLEENVCDGYCFGVPVFAGQPSAIGAISASMLKLRYTPQREQEIVNALRATAAAIERGLQ